MSNTNKQMEIIRYLPDCPFFIKLISKLKIKKMFRSALSEREVLLGENNENEKKRIVNMQKKKWKRETERVNASIDRLFEKIPYYKKNEDLLKVRTDILFMYFAYGFEPNEYFAFRLDNKTVNQKKEFISSRLRMKYRCQMNDLLQAHIFNDKSETYKIFKDQYKREVVSIEKEKDYDKFLHFIKKYPIFVKKQVYMAQGQSVELVDINKTGMDAKDYFHELIKTGKHVLEEKIEQTSDMSAFNNTSVNTVRAITFNTKLGFRVPYCMIRTGQMGSFVDNSGAGGIQAEIDFDTGEVISDGYDELGGKYAVHPASGTRFKGYQLPDWDELRSLVFSSASKIPDIKFIGWDLAHTKEGWVIVEGNENCYVIALQQIRDSGMKRIFENIMKDMELNA